MGKLKIKLAADREILRTKARILQARLAVADARDRMATDKAKLKQLQPKKPTPA